MMDAQGGNDSSERLRELATKIATEQDHDRITALIREFNQLLDGKKEEKHKPTDP